MLITQACKLPPDQIWVLKKLEQRLLLFVIYNHWNIANTHIFFTSVYRFLFSEVCYTSIFWGKYALGITLSPSCSAPFVDSVFFNRNILCKRRRCKIQCGEQLWQLCQWEYTCMCLVLSVKLQVCVPSVVSEIAGVCA